VPGFLVDRLSQQPLGENLTGGLTTGLVIPSGQAGNLLLHERVPLDPKSTAQKNCGTRTFAPHVGKRDSVSGARSANARNLSSDDRGLRHHAIRHHRCVRSAQSARQSLARDRRNWVRDYRQSLARAHHRSSGLARQTLDNFPLA
jgi:hypothetical protein